VPQPPLLLISACLLGHAVRYDGGHKLCPRLAALRQVRWFPVCPEVLAGLGIPRPSMELRHNNGVAFVVRCADGLDITDRLRGACLRIAQEALAKGVQGAVVKSRSPSCSAGGASFCQEQDGDPGRYGAGLLVQALRELAPGLPVIDEAAFEDGGRQGAFFRKIGAICAP